MSQIISEVYDWLQQQIQYESNGKLKGISLEIEKSEDTLNIECNLAENSKLGNCFNCNISEVRTPKNNLLIGIAINYFDDNNLRHYFIRGEDNLSKDCIKRLVIIFESYKFGDFGFGHRYHIQF